MAKGPPADTGSADYITHCKMYAHRAHGVDDHDENINLAFRVYAAFSFLACSKDSEDRDQCDERMHSGRDCTDLEIKLNTKGTGRPSSSQTKPVPNLRVDLAGFGIVGSTKGRAVVQEEAPVGDVQRNDGQVQVFP